MPDGPGVLEIRVHGVHGTSPQSMLGTSKIGQVAGDGLTGLYRTEDGKLPNRTLPENVAVEAYSWGALTSGVSGMLGWARRAAWLLLLPFALVNLAYWARPELGDGSPTATRSARVVRTAALLLTMLLVLGACLVGIDLVAWQCYRGGTPACSALPGLVDFMGRDPWQALPRRLALGTLVPLAGLALLWLLSRQSTARLEEVVEIDPPPESGGAVLTRRAMWAGKDVVQRLRRLHIAFAMLVVIGYSGLPLAYVCATADDVPAWTWLLVAELTLALVVAVRVGHAAGSLAPGDVEYVAEEGRPAAASAQVLLWICLAMLVVHLALLTLPDYGRLDQGGDLFGHNVWFIFTLFALAAAGAITFSLRMGVRAFWGSVLLVPLLVLGSTWVRDWLDLPWAVPITAWVVLLVGWVVAVRAQYGGRDTSPVAWQGAGASVLLNAAGWTALLFTTAAVTFTADRLNGSEHDVADLQTSYQAKQVGSDVSAKDLVMVDQYRASGRYVYKLGGDVTLVGGVVDVTGDQVVIRSGRLEVESLVRLLPGATKESERIAVRLGSTEMHNSVLSFGKDATLVVEDGCLRSGAATERKPPSSCTVEQDGFVASSAVDVGGSKTSLETPTGRSEVLVTVSEPPQAPLVLPQVLIWAPLAQVLWFLLAIGVAVICLRRLQKHVRPGIVTQVEVDEVAPRDQAGCIRARTTAAFVHRAERLLDLIGAVTVPVVLLLILSSSTGRAPWQLWSGFRTLAGLALWGVLGISAALVLVLSRMRTSEKTRKAVGILWDLTTFWPRAAHPLAPPCYAERVVPELLTRVRWGLRRGGPGGPRRVVLSGHSQGSAILMAVLSRLGDDLSDVRVITYGSQIRSWYGRIFPGVLGPKVLGYEPTQGTVRFSDSEPDAPQTTPTRWDRDVTPLEPPTLRERLDPPLPVVPGQPASVPRWVNLFRRSDPLGFRVFSDFDGPRRDVYVHEVPPREAGDPGPMVMTHGGYPHCASYAAATEAWYAEVPPGAELPHFYDVPFFPDP